KLIEIIETPEKAEVLVDPMRREIVRLLAERAMTESELADVLGLSDPSVGYHLVLLRKAGLIRLERKEVEEHGIVTKLYRSTALVTLINDSKLPLRIRRYFMPVNTERVRGAIAALRLAGKNRAVVDSNYVDSLAKWLNDKVIEVARTYRASGEPRRESVLNDLYLAALRQMTNVTSSSVPRQKRERRRKLLPKEGRGHP
ncbi:MAG TPA: helix-turn-helix domain-containing protein, partial [Candidatus Bathyarchaeia archaeon]